MKQYVRCKACGYIMEADKVGKLCPACGVPAKAFEPYEERISEKRKRVLDLHIHPIVVHLAQGLAPLIVLFAIVLAILGEGALKTTLVQATRVLAAFLPLSVILAFAAGLIDGNLRFHKVTTPLLVKKMIFGALFFVLSLGAAALALFVGLDGGGARFLRPPRAAFAGRRRPPRQLGIRAPVLALPGLDHSFGLDQLVELLAAQDGQLDRGLPEREVLLVRELGYLRGRVVADSGIEGGHRHETPPEVARASASRSALMPRTQRSSKLAIAPARRSMDCSRL